MELFMVNSLACPLPIGPHQRQSFRKSKSKWLTGKPKSVVDSQFHAEVLIQALPYIQSFRGQTFVVKYGGSAMRNPELLESVIQNVILLQLVGIQVILVHGGGPEIDTWLKRLGIEKKTENGLRVTDEETMDVVEMVLAGRTNKLLVAEFQKAGANAVGLSGRDADLLKAVQIDPALGQVGDIRRVNSDILTVLNKAGYLPVVCSVATDEDHRPLNVNADIAAGAIAAAVKAAKLILLTDTDGVLSDRHDTSTRISHIGRNEIDGLIRSGVADAGMIPKLRSASEALEAGVGSVHLINGSVPNSLLVEVFTDGGCGTMLR
jgi:acetylglutamate kinase